MSIWSVFVGIFFGIVFGNVVSYWLKSLMDDELEKFGRVE